MAMDADVVINLAMVRKINGSFSRIYLRFNTGKILRDLVKEEMPLHFYLIIVSDRKYPGSNQNDHIGTIQETDMFLIRSISGGLISRLLLPFCTLSDTSFSPDGLLFC